MIAQVFIGQNPAPKDTEAVLAGRLLERALRAWPARCERVHADSIHALAETALKTSAWQTLPSSARVLLLAHDQVLPAPGCLAALAAAIDKGADCAWACDAASCGPADYLTLRGMERFSAHRGKLPPGAATAPPPLAMLARRDALQDGRWQDAVRVPAAWVHDFSGYRSHRREEMLACIPPDCVSVLDVGGGAGGFLQAVKDRSPNCRTALVEMSPDACCEARTYVDIVWQGDFLSLGIDERFTCITFLDVLEHLADPRAMLDKARGLLAAGGCVIASIPNVGHWSVVADLLEGRWDYAPAGIQCITHLRFFTQKGIAELFEDAGFVVTQWGRACMPPPPWFSPLPASGLELDAESLATVAWHCVARPA